MTSHGLSGHPLYLTWNAMMQRCYNPDCQAFAYYGGRGIAVCPEWHDVAAFISWIEENLGPRPGGTTPGGRAEYSIDRWPDNDGNYEPGNVRWATLSEQQRNTRQNVLLTLDGETRCAAEWAELLGIGEDTIHSRLNYGWTAEQALATAVHEQGGSRPLTFNGVTRSLAEWAEHLGIYERTLMDRIRHNWPVEKVLTGPGCQPLYRAEAF